MHRKFFPLALLAALLAAGSPWAAAAPDYRAWIEAMKTDRRGPFDQIRWYCKDGEVLPPGPYACEPHGGGVQHGQWTPRTKALREAGYFVASFLADADPAALAASRGAGELPQILVQQFLVRADDGWILRGARYYRGAFQEEDERKGARKLLLRLVGDPAVLGTRLAFLRTAARLLPHGAETPSVHEVRELAATLAGRDPTFTELRNKIHTSLEPGDAEAVTRYAAHLADDTQKAEYAALAQAIGALYRTDLGATLDGVAGLAKGDEALASAVAAVQAALAADAGPRGRYALTAGLLEAIRDRLPAIQGEKKRLALVDASLELESAHFAAGAELAPALAGLSRRARLELLGTSLRAQYGAGLVSRRELDAANADLTTLTAADPKVGDYHRTLDYLALPPTWATQAMRREFGAAMAKLDDIEPKADLFVQDQLRGSPLFFFAKLIDGLVRDADRLAGVRSELFGADVGTGLRSLNPGLARGVLRLAQGHDFTKLEPDGIYLLPETVSDLPPVRGILTQGEGNPLSHVQLLARNLGIPNVGVDTAVVERLKPHEGERVILAVSHGGSVRLLPDGGANAALFDEDTKATDKPRLIHVEADKLQLDRREFIDLAALRASDSGHLVGPKAAKLGELKQHFPEAVAEGVAIPFGFFRGLLEQPMPDGSGTVFDWMRANYRALAALAPEDPSRATATEAFRAKLEAWARHADPGPEFRAALAAKLAEKFGADGSYGVFVRSDTNVEDLAGFTGAGLNLTVPNVVGFENIMNALSEVWASPFSARSFAWRQSLMDEPEHVYPAVLLLRGVDNEKSGVMVTRDVDTGSPEWLSIAVNEGVGGAVDGQAAESLRVRTTDGAVRLLAQATAAERRQLDPAGGIVALPTSGSDYVLQPAEIAKLVTLAKEIPERFPPIVDASGAPAPADIEFGFVKGELRLFQLRPFLENARTRSLGYLNTLDAGLAANAAQAVPLDAVPSARYTP
ncbi:MAG: phosphoenolpyruvate synthase [Gammaproteobacteria bacterium]|nr:phosphoenolpyruvate synthase [Gammaproteobacteria bacterium]